jgi:hypothetical protein
MWGNANVYFRGLFGAELQNTKCLGHKRTDIIVVVTGNFFWDQIGAPASHQNIIESIDIVFSGNRVKICGY